MTAFETYFHMIINQGGHEAVKDRSPIIEAHHLLLAIADYPGTDAHRILSSVGLDRQGVREALDREFEHSLQAAGVSLVDFTMPRPSGGPTSPSIGASAKLALERSFTTGRKKDFQSGHLLLGILTAQVGTVPRALALAGIDREQLVEQVKETIAPR